MIKIDTDRLDEFCHLFFTTIQSCGLLPDSGTEHFRDYGMWLRRLVKKIRATGIDAGWLEWHSSALKKAERKHIGELAELKLWIDKNLDLFDDYILDHLARSADGRGFGFVMNRDVLTPAEVAELTSTAESGWRNKCAAGAFPGAFKKGKQWLIPRSVLVDRGII